MKDLRPLLYYINMRKLADVSGVSYDIIKNYKKHKKEHFSDDEYNAVVAAIKKILNLGIKEGRKKMNKNELMKVIRNMELEMLLMKSKVEFMTKENICQETKDELSREVLRKHDELLSVLEEVIKTEDMEDGYVPF